VQQNLGALTRIFSTGFSTVAVEDSCLSDGGTTMQTQFSTANPDLASLPITGYRMETPPPPDPIDPPDNQGGGGTTTSQPDPDEDPTNQGG
jgi:hypothetical protein